MTRRAARALNNKKNNGNGTGTYCIYGFTVFAVVNTAEIWPMILVTSDLPRIIT